MGNIVSKTSSDIKDAYPLSLMEEVQDRLAGAAICSKLDLQSEYWQLPVDVNDREKQLSLWGQEWDQLNLRGCLLDCVDLPLFRG